jgi:ligand-binding SRPBCC domain-containing protein
MQIFSFKSELWLPDRIEAVFSFFADAHNLELITPPWLHFEILTEGPISMQTDTLIDYRLRLRGIPLRWRTRIVLWEPPSRFIDLQMKGPYRLWRHEHVFMRADSGTRCIDHVQYALHGGRFLDRLLVRPDVERIFDYRKKKMLEIFSTAGVTKADA